jgi:hypothetical protein
MSTKKGFVYKSIDFAKVASVDPKWYYNWGGSRSFCDDPALPFTPMKWGKGTVLFQCDSPEVLGFNEPDRADQSSLTPQDALALWDELIRSGKRIGSPAMAGNPVKPGSWLEQFNGDQILVSCEDNSAFNTDGEGIGMWDNATKTVIEDTESDEDEE